MADEWPTNPLHIFIKMYAKYNCRKVTLTSKIELKVNKPGGIAQLVERCFCTADVSGSSPLTSTTIFLSLISYPWLCESRQ